MDSLARTKIECWKKAFWNKGLEEKFNFCVNEKTGKLTITPKDDKKQNRCINSRFDILDL